MEFISSFKSNLSKLLDKKQHQGIKPDAVFWFTSYQYSL